MPNKVNEPSRLLKGRAMPNTIWKEYEAHPLTHSAAHYLMAIKNLLTERGYARVTDVARELNITRGSCSISLKPLKQRGLVTVDENKFLSLSEEGRRLAELVERNDEVLQSFMTDVLGIDKDQAEIDACKIEHLLSIETSVKMAEFLKFIGRNQTVTKNFLKALREHRPECKENTAACDLCDTHCLATLEH
jgi:DtxR family Mn-dependent transcriptional regulator